MTRGTVNGGRDELPAEMTLLVAMALSSVHPGLSVSDIFLSPEGARLTRLFHPTWLCVVAL